MRRILAGILFLCVLLATVVGLHLYIARRLVFDTQLASPFREASLVALAALFATLFVQPIGERLVRPPLARVISWPASLWMGFAFLLVVLLAATDLLLVLLGAAGVAESATSSVLRPRALLVVAAAAVAGLAGLRTAMRPPAVRRRELQLPRWPAALDGFRIVQITDVHIGPILGRRFAERIVARCNALEPDLLAVTGDLVDGSVHALTDEVAPFAQLRARHGVFFVTGNHDYYSGERDWVARARELGMRVLRNERVTISARGAAFDLAGVDDHRGDLVRPGQREDLERALEGRDPERPVVLLAHDPSTFRRARRHPVDLQISGHTHGGQIWPFVYLVRLVIPWVAGHYRSGEAQLYVSRGTGFWGPPMRILAPAEITEIVLRAPPG
ncbi:MAG: metallophosphoesterase [Deltaproteobacteria bacterium]|nr:MAG: metallophosphoesterase [Deltaproteobacteria bacterium]